MRHEPDLDAMLYEQMDDYLDANAEDCPEDCECPECIYNRLHNIYEARS